MEINILLNILFYPVAAEQQKFAKYYTREKNVELLYCGSYKEERFIAEAAACSVNDLLAARAYY